MIRDNDYTTISVFDKKGNHQHHRHHHRCRCRRLLLARIAHNNRWRNSTLQKSANNKQVQRQHDCYNRLYLTSFRICNNFNVELAFGKRAHKLCKKNNNSKTKQIFLSSFFRWISLKYYCSRNTQFSFTQLYDNTTTTPINTISRQTFDADQQWLNQASRSQSISPTSNNNIHHHQQQQQHQVYSDPPPPYDEIVLDMRLASTSPNTAIVY